MQRAIELDPRSIDAHFFYGRAEFLQGRFAQAAERFERAALQGYAKAQNRLSARYESGEGVDADPVESLAWAILAAAQGNISAAQRRDALVDSLSAMDVAAAKQRAAELPIAVEASP